VHFTQSRLETLNQDRDRTSKARRGERQQRARRGERERGRERREIGDWGSKRGRKRKVVMYSRW
jgi:hypothetical protein